MDHNSAATLWDFLLHHLGGVEEWKDEANLLDENTQKCARCLAV